IKVGAGEEPFKVHQDILCQRSRFFRNAFKGQFREAKEGSMKLRDTDVDIFRLIMFWLYRDEIPKSSLHTGVPDASTGETPNDRAFSKIYIFAEVYDFPALRNRVMAELFTGYGAGTIGLSFPNATIIRAFGELREDSALCRFIVDVAARQWRPDRDCPAEVRQRVELPHAYLLALATMLAKRSHCFGSFEDRLKLEDYIEFVS
ncbi:uncharacterized protein K452DRAFT_226632, partial [Aplosporella prunicola CBS 121167]